VAWRVHQTHSSAFVFGGQHAVWLVGRAFTAAAKSFRPKSEPAPLLAKATVPAYHARMQSCCRSA
jgi:hypothetical protein